MYSDAEHLAPKSEALVGQGDHLSVTFSKQSRLRLLPVALGLGPPPEKPPASLVCTRPCAHERNEDRAPGCWPLGARPASSDMLEPHMSRSAWLAALASGTLARTGSKRPRTDLRKDDF